MNNNTDSTTIQDNKLKQYLSSILDHAPNDWLKLTTHRLDIYNEALAKSEFLEHFEKLLDQQKINASALAELPTAFDYIRLGHPLSCILEWALANLNQLKAQNVISFSSKTIPVMAVLRKNLLDKKKTLILYKDALPKCFDEHALKNVYGYQFELKQVENDMDVSTFDGSVVYLSERDDMSQMNLSPQIDFYVNTYAQWGAIMMVNGAQNEHFIREIQHVRRRETIAMTPSNCYAALSQMVDKNISDQDARNAATNKEKVIQSIKEITGANAKAVVGSSGLSIQYAIVMGLIDYAQENHPGKAVKIIVPPNCYGGTNDQARRVVACVNNTEVVDLPVDGDNDMVSSVDSVLEKVAKEDAVPYIIAEIPTNPRVEVPDLEKLREALSKKRTTENGNSAVDPVFILDQTFCPNVHFLGESDVLSSVRTISYVSGSKFPSGGLCTAGYCTANNKAEALMDKIDQHLHLCDNEATPQQLKFLAQQLPSMNQRIQKAYQNTREFVQFISETLPEAKINFVSEALAEQGFTPSVFSLDLPTKGNSAEEKEAHKKVLNNKLINMMIDQIPYESKYCVSYGQLKGCYWTIPATSTQGTTKEGDKDYIVRVSLSPDMNLDLHKKVFSDFVKELS